MKLIIVGEDEPVYNRMALAILDRNKEKVECIISDLSEGPGAKAVGWAERNEVEVKIFNKVKTRDRTDFLVNACAMIREGNEMLAFGGKDRNTQFFIGRGLKVRMKVVILRLEDGEVRKVRR